MGRWRLPRTTPGRSDDAAVPPNPPSDDPTATAERVRELADRGFAGAEAITPASVVRIFLDQAADGLVRHASFVELLEG